MTIVTCQAELDISAASTLQQQLLAVMQTREPVEIEAQNVSRIHTAALQLFLSAIRDAQTLGLAFQWREPSSALVEGARLLGLTDPLYLGEFTVD